MNTDNRICSRPQDLMISMIRDQRALMEETSRALLDAAAQIGSLGEESHLCQHRMSGMSSELAELNRRLVGVNAELAALRSKLELVAREKASALVSLEEKDATIAELRSANETLKADLAAAGASPPSASSRVAVTASAPIRPSLSLQRLGRANDSAWAMIVTDDSPREDLMLKIRAMEQRISDLSRTANINADVGDSYKEELEGLYLRLKRLESPEAADVGTFKSVVSIMNAAASALDPRAGGDAGWDRQGCEEVVRKLVEGLVSSVAPQRASRVSEMVVQVALLLLFSFLYRPCRSRRAAGMAAGIPVRRPVVMIWRRRSCCPSSACARGSSSSGACARPTSASWTTSRRGGVPRLHRAAAISVRSAAAVRSRREICTHGGCEPVGFGMKVLQHALYFYLKHSVCARSTA